MKLAVRRNTKVKTAPRHMYLALSCGNYDELCYYLFTTCTLDRYRGLLTPGLVLNVI